MDPNRDVETSSPDGSGAAELTSGCYRPRKRDAGFCKTRRARARGPICDVQVGPRSRLGLQNCPSPSVGDTRGATILELRNFDPLIYTAAYFAGNGHPEAGWPQ